MPCKTHTLNIQIFITIKSTKPNQIIYNLIYQNGPRISFRCSFALIVVCSFMMAALGLVILIPKNPLIQGGHDHDAAKYLLTLEGVHKCG